MKIGTLVRRLHDGTIGVVVKYEEWGHARVPHVMMQAPGNPIKKIGMAGLEKVEVKNDGKD